MQNQINCSPIALTIAGSDSSGGAGIQADLKAFAATGVYGASVITCITAQNTMGVQNVEPIKLEIISAQLESVLNDIQPAAIKTGMLYSTEIIELVSEKLEWYLNNISENKKIYLIIDPVLIATTGDKLTIENKEYDDIIEAFKTRLLPTATVITPNLYEASHLLDWEVKTLDDMKTASLELFQLGPKNVVLKGGHRIKDTTENDVKKAIDILYDGDYHLFETPRLDKEVHGTGCTFASAIAGYMVKGFDVKTSVSSAKELVTKGIEHSLMIGSGIDVVNGLATLWQNLEFYEIMFSVSSASDQLLNLLKPGLIPEVGINIGYARTDAKTLMDICALTGRIVRIGENACSLGKAEFGTSKHVGRIILAAMKFDEKIRCAMNIKYRPEIIDICKDIGFSIGTFNRDHEPNEVSSMEWGTKTAIEELGYIPDIIFDKGGIGKEPMIRIIDRDPDAVIKKLKKIIGKYL